MSSIIDQKIRELNQWNNEVRIPLPQDFVLYNGQVVGDGYYLTLRLRHGLLYQSLNEVREGQWKAGASDGSILVMYKDVPQKFYEILSEVNELVAIQERQQQDVGMDETQTTENKEQEKTEEKKKES